MASSAIALLSTIGYCAAVGATEAHQFRIGPATGWALAAVLPLALAADALRRRSPSPLLPRLLSWAIIALSALPLSLLLTLANGVWQFGATGIDPAAWLLRRAPLYGAVLLLVELLIELGRRSEKGDAKPLASPATAGPPPAAAINVVLPDGQVLADVSEVTRVIGAANYAQFETASGTFLARATLGELDQLLAPHGFVRVHRSMLVNWAIVQRVARQGRKLNLYLRDGGTITVGETYRRNLLSAAQPHPAEVGSIPSRLSGARSVPNVASDADARRMGSGDGSGIRTDGERAAGAHRARSGNAIALGTARRTGADRR